MAQKDSRWYLTERLLELAARHMATLALAVREAVAMLAN
jgi:hypothetical protein